MDMFLNARKIIINKKKLIITARGCISQEMDIDKKRIYNIEYQCFNGLISQYLISQYLIKNFVV